MVDMSKGGKSDKEIAAELGLTHGTVAGQLWRHHKNVELYSKQLHTRYMDESYRKQVDIAFKPEPLASASMEGMTESPRCEHEGCRNTKQHSKRLCATHLRTLIEEKHQPQYKNLGTSEFV
jgi:hypothetical protein